ncbi:MAG: L-rhamnose/proton symporter RhaT [Acidobacteriaceae bacterium]
MNAAAWMGALLAVTGGGLQGAFAVPMKYAHKWKHENIWLVFTLTGLLLFPWILTIAAVPSLGQIYRQAPLSSLVLIAVCGIGWGVGAALVGVAFRMLGIGLGFAIILGLSALLGSVVPFLFGPRQDISASRGWLYLLGACAMAIGIVLVSLAGSIREKAEETQRGLSDGETKRFAVGLTIAILAGILSSLLSIAIAFTTGMVDTARQFGASAVWAANVVTAPTTTGGAVANVVYCAIMLRRNHSAALFCQPGVMKHWLYGIAMGACWYGGLAIYGLGEQKIGSVDGWPLFIGAMILSSSAAGFLSGEWKSVGARGKWILCGGSLLIFLSLIVVGMAHNG